MFASLCIRRIAASVFTFCIVSLSCRNSSPEVKSVVPKPAQKTTLPETFLRDIDNASKVINDNNLILNLTHLQLMDRGGKKYYPLGKDTISYLLSSVTKNLYQDIILVNWEGAVIYSMRNDDIFSKNIADTNAPFPLTNPYKSAMEGNLYSSGCAESQKKECIIASPLDKDEKRWGVIVLIVKSGCESSKIAQKAKIDSSSE